MSTHSPTWPRPSAGRRRPLVSSRPLPVGAYAVLSIQWLRRAQQTQIVRAFRKAWHAKDIDALIGLLDPEASTIADGGGQVSAAPHPIEGREQSAHYLLDLARRFPHLTMLERTVNGQLGLVAQHNGITVTVMAFNIVDGQIKHLWAVRNPDKLRSWPGVAIVGDC